MHASLLALMYATCTTSLALWLAHPNNITTTRSHNKDHEFSLKSDIFWLPVHVYDKWYNDRNQQWKSEHPGKWHCVIWQEVPYILKALQSSEHWYLITHWHSITLQQARNCSNTTLRTSNLKMNLVHQSHTTVTGTSENMNILPIRFYKFLWSLTLIKHINIQLSIFKYVWLPTYLTNRLLYLLTYLTKWRSS